MYINIKDADSTAVRQKKLAFLFGIDMLFTQPPWLTVLYRRNVLHLGFKRQGNINKNNVCQFGVIKPNRLQYMTTALPAVFDKQSVKQRKIMIYFIFMKIGTSNAVIKLKWTWKNIAYIFSCKYCYIKKFSAVHIIVTKAFVFQRPRELCLLLLINMLNWVKQSFSYLLDSFQ